MSKRETSTVWTGVDPDEFEVDVEHEVIADLTVEHSGGVADRLTITLENGVQYRVTARADRDGARLDFERGR